MIWIIIILAIYSLFVLLFFKAFSYGGTYDPPEGYTLKNFCYALFFPIYFIHRHFRDKYGKGYKIK